MGYILACLEDVKIALSGGFYIFTVTRFKYPIFQNSLMLFNKLLKIKLCVVLALYISTANCQPKAIEKIDTTDLYRHLSYLASDELQGRMIGTEVNGLDMAAEYIAEQAKKIGLQAPGENYFQKFPIESIKPDFKNTHLEVLNNSGKVVHKTDSVLALDRSIRSLEQTGSIVFAGFGWKSKDGTYDDFAQLDLQDKIVIVSAGKPDEYKREEIYKWNNQLESGKKDRALEAGAKALVIINSPYDSKGDKSAYDRIARYMNRTRYSIKRPREESDTRGFLFTTPTFGDQILGGKGLFREYLNQIADSGKPNSFEVQDQQLRFKLNKETLLVDAKNVIGIIEGSDPELKNECVVFMAHYDHIGINENGEVYNGADDNGSGTVALMEIAEAFQNLQPVTKRSIVFLWVTAEEVGLLGSKHYSTQPVFPLDQTRLCINLDMVGRVYEPRDSVYANHPKRVRDFNGLFTVHNDFWPFAERISDKMCKKLGIEPDKTLPSYFLRSSDHYHFHSNQVPIINYATGYHADFHKTGDDIHRINFEKIKLVAQLCFLVGLEVANLQTIP